MTPAERAGGRVLARAGEQLGFAARARRALRCAVEIGCAARLHPTQSSTGLSGPPRNAPR